MQEQEEPSKLNPKSLEKTILEGGEKVDPGTQHYLENPASINPANKIQVAMIKFVKA
jgi:hypothetical protein